MYTLTALATGFTTAMSTHMEMWCDSGLPAQKSPIKLAKRRSLSFALFDYGVIECRLMVMLQEHAS